MSLTPIAYQRADPAAGGPGGLVLEGEPALLSQLREPIRRALSGRQAFYHVQIDWVGRCGEVMVRITGSKGRLPLLFSNDLLEPGYVRRVVTDTVERFAF